jgi:hypothetical protein
MYKYLPNISEQVSTPKLSLKVSFESNGLEY